MSLTISQGVAVRTLNEQWAGHKPNRLTWAFKAYERFIGSLSAEIRERLVHTNHQAEAYVVVFGKTQVGKTTLLLELMGVSPAAMERVSTVLRGGRAHGHSATATTMEYRRSEDQHWGLRIKNDTRWYDDDSQITSALGELRASMERRDLVVDSPCVVSIPEDYFVTATDQGPVIKMLDLPGDQPANPIEQEHVQNMASKYVPLADLILLVGRGDDLSFLQPGGLTLPGIEDWQSVPGRFRIVTTYSFTPKSVRDLVRQHGETADAQRYRQRLIEQIEEFAPLSEDARIPRFYFPLEIGKSWDAEKESQSELYARVSPLIDRLKYKLRLDIKNATTPEARLRGAVEARVVIKRVKETRLKEMQDTAKMLAAELEKVRNDFSQAQKAAQQKCRESQEISSRLTLLTDDRMQQDLSDHLYLAGSTPLGDPGARVSGFQVLISRTRSSLIQRISDSRPEIASLSDTAWFWRGVRVDSESMTDLIRRNLNYSFSDLENHLSEYMWDKYWFTGSDSDYQSDLKRLKTCLAAGESITLKIGRQCWLYAAKQHLQELQKELEALQQQVYAWGSHIKETRQLLAQAQEEAAAHEKDCEDFRIRMERDLNESYRFIEILDDEYLHELKHRYQSMQKKQQPTRIFIDLLSITQIIHDRKKLLNHIEPAAI